MNLWWYNSWNMVIGHYGLHHGIDLWNQVSDIAIQVSFKKIIAFQSQGKVQNSKSSFGRGNMLLTRIQATFPHFKRSHSLFIDTYMIHSKSIALQNHQSITKVAKPDSLQKYIFLTYSRLWSTVDFLINSLPKSITNPNSESYFFFKKPSHFMVFCVRSLPQVSHIIQNVSITHALIKYLIPTNYTVTQLENTYTYTHLNKIMFN